MNLNYTWEKVHKAVLALAKGQDNINRRLWEAYTQGLSGLKTEDFPEALAPYFREIERQLTHEKPRNAENRSWTTTMEMNPEEASILAEKIVDLYDALARQYSESDITRGNLAG